MIGPHLGIAPYRMCRSRSTHLLPQGLPHNNTVASLLELQQRWLLHAWKMQFTSDLSIPVSDAVVHWKPPGHRLGAKGGHQGPQRHGQDTETCCYNAVQDKQRAEAAAKKLEAKKMAEEEAAQLANSAKKSSSKAASASKVHSYSYTPSEYLCGTSCLCKSNSIGRRSLRYCVTALPVAPRHL